MTIPYILIDSQFTRFHILVTPRYLYCLTYLTVPFNSEPSGNPFLSTRIWYYWQFTIIKLCVFPVKTVNRKTLLRKSYNVAILKMINPEDFLELGIRLLHKENLWILYFTAGLRGNETILTIYRVTLENIPKKHLHLLQTDSIWWRINS